MILELIVKYFITSSSRGKNWEEASPSSLRKRPRVKLKMDDSAFGSSLSSLLGVFSACPEHGDALTGGTCWDLQRNSSGRVRQSQNSECWQLPDWKTNKKTILQPIKRRDALYFRI